MLTTARKGLSAFGGFARLRLTHLPLSGESPTIHSIQLATRAFSRSPFSPFRKLDAGRCDRALLIPRRGQRDLDGSLGGCTVMGFAESVVPRLQAISLAVSIDSNVAAAKRSVKHYQTARRISHNTLATPPLPTGSQPALRLTLDSAHEPRGANSLTFIHPAAFKDAPDSSA